MLRLAQFQLASLGPVMRLQQDRMGRLYELFDFWDHSRHEVASFTVDGEVHTAEYTFVPPAFLEYISKGEKFGCHIAGMMFISSDVLRAHPDWVPYIVLKLHCSKFVDPGLDETGRVQHWRSLFGTIRLAGMAMSCTELQDFLAALIEHDDSGYFDLDEEARRFIERGGGSPQEARRRYLESHHRNHWVRLGRNEEARPEHLRESGFRNHAEVIYRHISGLGLSHTYTAAMFIHELAYYDPETPLVIDALCSRIAYLLTKDGNGLANLVRFLDLPVDEPGYNVIVRLSVRGSTWTALAKRLSYGIHRAEQQARGLLEEKQHEVRALVAAASAATTRYNEQVVALRRATPKPGLFSDTLETLKTLSGDWSAELRALEEMLRAVAVAAKETDEAADVLLAAI